MSKCKITVIRRTLNSDLAQVYCKNEVSLCPVFQEGQEFVVSPITERPKEFCEWAWNDLYKVILSLSTGGSFSNVFKDWMNDEKTLIACCTDGIRPVIFKIERFDE